MQDARHWGLVVLLRLLKKTFSSFKLSPIPIGIAIAVVALIYLGCSRSPELLVQPTKKKTSTWLQLSQLGQPKFLELQAQREQLEHYLTSFEAIAQATIALSIEEEKPKLSVILSLQQHAELTPPLIYSITDYLLTSIPGLTKEYLTISDSLGNMYSPMQVTSINVAAIEKHLEKLLPKQDFQLSYIQHENQLQMDINERYLDRLSTERKEKLLEYIGAYFKHNYHEQVHVSIFPFAKSIDRFTKIALSLTIFFSSLGIISLASFYLAFYAYDRLPSESYKIKGGIHIPKLVEILQNEPPERISLILSYMDPQKAQELLEHFPKEVRGKIRVKW